MKCKLKALRTSLKWSQGKLQLLSGVPQTTISAIERGVVVPSVLTAMALANALNCTVEDLFEEER